MIYLVGAGPGDPGLITVKALEALRNADVVLYDKLADPQFLLETKTGCSLIDVGKSAGRHTKPQDETISLLIEYGRKNLDVVRLKGGDPFLFGRGAEEAEALGDAGIPFIVVPGVSALNAVTTYAGIPVTHRGYASSLGVATGHGAKGKDTDPVNWSKLASGVDTIVVFMGVGNLKTIVGEITKGGFSPLTPAAIIERGCTPLQRVITGTVETIVDIARKEQVTPPALFIAGETVSLAEKLSWYKPGPLAGLKIGVTRPSAQSKKFANKLRGMGATPVLMPTIKTVDTIDNDDVTAVMKKLDSYDYIVFSSTNGVDSFFRALYRQGFDARMLSGKKLAAIGPVTGDALSGYGISADLTASTFVAEGMLETILSSDAVDGRKFLLVRSNIGRDILSDGLKKAGALVDQAVFYSTQTAELRPEIIDMVNNGEIDVITFTSSSTVDGFFKQVSSEKARRCKLGSIGPQTSLALQSHETLPDIEAVEYTTNGLVDAILAYYSTRDNLNH